MSYKGTTAASSVSNPPAQVWGAIKGVPGMWTYSSTHTTTDVKTANFFTDAKQLGMRQGDFMIGNNASTSTPKGFFGIVGAVSTSGAALQSAVSTTAA